MLEQHGVADDQVRAAEAGDLIVRKVPRHDPEDDANRAALNECGAFAPRQFDGFVGHKLFAVVGVVLVDGLAEVDLAECLLTRLAHLANDDVGELFAALCVQVGNFADHFGALFDGCGARPLVMRLLCERRRCDQLGVGNRRIVLDVLPGGRVDHCVVAHLRSP